MIVNVSATHTAIVTSQLSRHDLLSWVNTTLKADFTKVDELCTGAAYCQMMHSMYPKAVPIKRVKFCTNLEHEFIDNFKILQTVFQKLQVQKAIPIDRLVRGKFQDNIEFLQWFKKFYDANNENIKTYDPVSVRNGQPMAFGTPALKRKSNNNKCFSPRTGGGGGGGAAAPNSTTTQHSYREEILLKNDADEHATHTLKRSLTRTELRHDLSMSPNFDEMPVNNSFNKKNNDEVKNELSTSNQVSQQKSSEIETSTISAPAYLAHAGLKLERILTYCLQEKASGNTNVDISRIKHIIYTEPNPELTENQMDNDDADAEFGAGDHVVVKNIVEEN